MTYRTQNINEINEINERNITTTIVDIIWLLIIIILIGLCFLWLLSNSNLYNALRLAIYEALPFPDSNKRKIISYIPTREQLVTQIIQNDINQICAANYNKPIGEELVLPNLSEEAPSIYKEPGRCDATYGTINDINWKAYVYGYRPRVILY